MRIIATFEEPVKREKLTLAAFSVDEIEKPDIQRDISNGLTKQLEMAIDKLGFLTPIIVTRKNGKYYVIDGQHRLEAMKSLGVREITGIIVDEKYYHYILEFNTEKPANVKEKSKQAYRLYMDILNENRDIVEEDLFYLLKEPFYVTAGFVLEEITGKFPVSFYESFLSKIDSFLAEKLSVAVEERRKKANKLYELNEAVNEKFAELGWENALLKGEIIRKAVQKTYGQRIRTIDDDFYAAVERVKDACRELTQKDFETGITY